MLPTSGDSQTALERIRLYPAHLPPFLSPGEAVELVLVPVGVEEETHGTSQVSRSIACRVVQRSGGEQSLGGIASVEKCVGDNCNLQDNQDNNTYDDKTSI